MSAYKLSGVSAVIRTGDGAIIPIDERNVDYLDYLDWLSAGGVPDPSVPLPIDPDSGVKVIDSLQGQLWIYRAGHYDAFTAFLSALTIEQSIIAKAMMHADAKWKSNNPLIVGFLGGMLGMDAAAIDSVFDAASEINPWAVA